MATGNGWGRFFRSSFRAASPHRWATELPTTADHFTWGHGGNSPGIRPRSSSQQQRTHLPSYARTSWDTWPFRQGGKTKLPLNPLSERPVLAKSLSSTLGYGRNSMCFKRSPYGFLFTKKKVAKYSIHFPGSFNCVKDPHQLISYEKVSEFFSIS